MIDVTSFLLTTAVGGRSHTWDGRKLTILHENGKCYVDMIFTEEDSEKEAANIITAALAALDQVAYPQRQERILTEAQKVLCHA